MNSQSAATRPPSWLWPHVVSLEAPLVAILWLAALAHVDDLRLMPGVLPGLGLAVWIIYLLDRILDTCGVPPESLSVRHYFYLRFRWSILLLVIPPYLALLIWLGLWVIPFGLLAHSLAQVIPIGLYLALYSAASSQTRRWLVQGGMLLILLLVNMLPLPLELRITLSILLASLTTLAISLRWHEKIEKVFRKEIAAGLIFAFGCTTWTRFHTLGNEGPDIWAEFILLSMLFVSNLTLISAHEKGPGQASSTARGATILSIGGLIAIALGYLPTTLLPLTLAIAGGLIGLEILWGKFRHLSEEAFRVWADVLVAVPAIVLLLLPD